MEYASRTYCFRCPGVPFLSAASRLPFLMALSRSRDKSKPSSRFGGNVAATHVHDIIILYAIYITQNGPPL